MMLFLQLQPPILSVQRNIAAICLVKRFSQDSPLPVRTHFQLILFCVVDKTSADSRVVYELKGPKTVSAHLALEFSGHNCTSVA